MPYREQHAASEAEQESLPPARILVVDDREENLLAVRASLAAPDYRLVEARSGEEALRHLLQDDTFALVLLDVRMPGMDGFEVAHLMRRRARTRFTPIVFLSADAIDLASAYRGYEAGAIDYMLKPLDPLVLRAKVAAFVELHQQRELIRRQGERLARAEARNHELQLAAVQLESERRERAALSDAVRMRDEFLMLASHELNTPLTPLLASIQSLLLSARAGRFEPTHAVRSLELAQRQIRRLARLVAELLEVTRIEGGKLALSLTDVDLAEVAREVVEAHREESARAGVPLQLEVRGSARGRWDRMRIEQIVTNLVANAVKFGDHKPVDVIVELDGDVARILVRDRGIGIGADHIGRIFDRFARAESSRHYAGLGLGLYIVRRLAEAHGGTVRVESAIGRGSTFTVELPARPTTGVHASA
ncbi:hybrid sensor histidine kinase/response regulator [Sandaracinus amylolyticus]|uniref:histidine kinase n=1 Tax=Sandaracinus amylolyticus TaxID=927083 RepID=A0A0F6YKU1_9BACT|nr:hybrid sensor histidine kinase/response regulator [Sandaracinus amylolyticus]AKF08778.1 two-component regulator [Sandaracinus amylolyticus]